MRTGSAFLLMIVLSLLFSAMARLILKTAIAAGPTGAMLAPAAGFVAPQPAQGRRTLSGKSKRHFSDMARS